MHCLQLQVAKARSVAQQMLQSANRYMQLQLPVSLTHGPTQTLSRNREAPSPVQFLGKTNRSKMQGAVSLRLAASERFRRSTCLVGCLEEILQHGGL